MFQKHFLNLDLYLGKTTPVNTPQNYIIRSDHPPSLLCENLWGEWCIFVKKHHSPHILMLKSKNQDQEYYEI